MAAFMKRYGKTILLCVLTLCAGLILGILLGVRSETGKEPDANEVMPAGQIGQVSILETTSVHVRCRFACCGHVQDTEQTGGELVGYTLSDITDRWPDARVTEWNGERVVIERDIERYCPQHYLLKLSDAQTFEVLRTDPETCDLSVIVRIPVQPERIAEEKEELEEGIPFDDLTQIDAYLESLES